MILFSAVLNSHLEGITPLAASDISALFQEWNARRASIGAAKGKKNSLVSKNQVANNIRSFLIYFSEKLVDHKWCQDKLNAIIARRKAELQKAINARDRAHEKINALKGGKTANVTFGKIKKRGGDRDVPQSPAKKQAKEL